MYASENHSHTPVTVFCREHRSTEEEKLHRLADIFRERATKMIGSVMRKRFLERARHFEALAQEAATTACDGVTR